MLLEDVYFGDVWLCGGQSNMQFTVNTAFNATEEIALANRYPHVRLLTVGQGTTSTEVPTPSLSNLHLTRSDVTAHDTHDTHMFAQPLPVLKTLEQPWSVANATSVGGKSWQHFSAVCWFFGKQLYDKYQVPIGLVSSNWGGTIVQAWSSPDALSKCKLSEPTVPAAATEATTSVVAEPTKLGGPNDNSVLWNAMIVPFLDLSLKGTHTHTAHARHRVGVAKWFVLRLRRCDLVPGRVQHGPRRLLRLRLPGHDQRLAQQVRQVRPRARLPLRAARPLDRRFTSPTAHDTTLQLRTHGHFSL